MEKTVLLFILFSLGVSYSNNSQNKNIQGLKESVEIIRDSWGINHIYAKNQEDLFFAQGYTAAKDRLFQFEIWRRQATGSVAEILGERELARDIGTRLFKFRGNLEEELNHYHKDGSSIINAYTNGVNAYINEINKTPDDLPIEFQMLGIKPKLWTPEVVISRHQGLLGNSNDELQIARTVAAIGEEKAKELFWFHPKNPSLNLDLSIDKLGLNEPILDIYDAFREPIKFEREDLVVSYQNNEPFNNLELIQKNQEDSLSIGSNNWLVSGRLMKNGMPLMANDPHRGIANPSLRYMVHLVAPGWNVIGGGEPEIPGISIGHNDYGAWGLTVFRTDGEDIYVYDINPENAEEYLYKGQWLPMNKINEVISIKGKPDKTVSLYYTHHGPVTFIDKKRNKAYAMRCAWLEPGGAPYLASLRMNQASDWESFIEACKYSNIPGENMIWADIHGDIGWQAVGIAPVRKNFSGLVPVPGDGRFEWEGYLPILEKPNALNPKQGYFATANQNVTPKDYTNWDAIGFSWADPFRGDRIEEVLSEKKIFDIEDMRLLQVDEVSVPAKIITKFNHEMKLSGKYAEVLDLLKDWDHKLTSNSIPASIYNEWENQIKVLAKELFIPEIVKDYISNIQLKKIIDWLENPETRFKENPIQERIAFLEKSFTRAIDSLTKKVGADPTKWHYGQTLLKHVTIKHPLGESSNSETREFLNVGPLPRGGNAYTVGSTGSDYEQSSGASFRIIVPVGDWDKTIGTNSPGQSGNPKSNFYKNLFKPWAENTYFPVYFSKDLILLNTVEKVFLIPKSE